MSSNNSDNEEEGEGYIVEKILDKRVRGGKTEYFIKWENYDDPSDNTWEPAENCVRI